MNSKAQRVYEFGPFQLEPSEYRLLRDGQTVLLTPKAFAMLLVLTENAGHVVEKNELMKLVWPETIVEESTIAQNVFTLRKVLGSSASGLPYIETVPKRGYRLAVPVREIYKETVEEAPLSHPERLSGPRTLSREHLIGAAGLAIIAASIGAISFGAHLFAGRNPFGPWHPEEPMTIARLTNTGNSPVSAISPDGKFVAYVLDNGSQESLWLRLVDTRRDLELVPAAAEHFQGVTFSDDGNWIYYSRGTALFEVSVMGGNSRRLVDDVDGAVTSAPGGRRFAFVRDDLRAGESAVILTDANGSGTKTLARRTLPEYFKSVAWAPGGDVIVASVGTRAGKRYMTLTEIAVNTGAERPLTDHRWYEARHVAWFSDKTALVVSASSRPSEPFQLWRISYPAGRVTKITNDLDDYFSPALTADAGGLVSSRRTDVSNIWVAPDPHNRAQRITDEGGRSERPSWTSDGRIVYESRTSGNRDLWIMNSDGSNKKQLTFDPAEDHSPSAASGAEHVYFVSDRTGIPHIWKLGTDGSSPTQLTDGDGEIMPDCSPDGTWLAYESISSGRPVVWRISTSGGTPVRLTNTLSRSPAIAPDGRLIALYYWDERPASPIRLAVISSTGGQPIKLFDFPDTTPSRVLHWSPDGRAVTYVVTRNGISNVWSQSLDGGPARPVTQFGADVITFFNWSRSGQQLVFSRSVTTRDVVLISHFK